jgi:asparaginyl-tRNA synthetase
MTLSIKKLIEELDNNNIDKNVTIYGWVRTVRSSSNTLGFCVINDGSNVNGMQIVISSEFINEDKISHFFKNVNTGTYLKCFGNIILSPAKGQKYELQLLDYEVKGTVEDSYPLAKSRMNLDTLREYIHLRGRTNTFGSIFRIRSSLMKYLHDFYHDEGFLHLDPNIITVNECEGGAGVFQVTENDLSKPSELKLIKETKTQLSEINKGDFLFEALAKDNKGNLSSITNDSNKHIKENTGLYDWSSDHFCNPVYLTVSSQLQLEAIACSLGNVYTMNKSFRSEHSSTTKHVSEFTHLEIEMINIDLNNLMNISEKMIKYVITRLFETNSEDLENLEKIISKGLIERLKYLQNCEYKKMRYIDVINEINNDIIQLKLTIPSLTDGDDLGSVHENYITQKYNLPIFLTHWPMKLKSFYMKDCCDGYCESYDLLLPYGIGELIGASMREDDYNKLISMMNTKGINPKNLEFYLDLRRYGSCSHGGFGLGFDRLLMLVTGIQNIKDVIPFPVYYKSCKY